MANIISNLLSKALISAATQSLKNAGYKLEEERTIDPGFGCHDPCTKKNYVTVSKKIYDDSIFGFGSRVIVPEAAKKLKQQLVGLTANPDMIPDITCSSKIIFIDKHSWYFDSPYEYYSFSVLFNLECSGDVFSGNVSHKLSSNYRIASLSVSSDSNEDIAYVLMRQVYKTFVPQDTPD